MTPEQSENAITLSALVVGGMFAYRKAVEPGIAAPARLRAEGKGGINAVHLAEDYKSVFGAGPPIEWGQWLKAVGVMYIGIAIVGAASPQIGGSLAILIGTSAVLGNGIAVLGDLKTSKSVAANAEPFRDSAAIRSAGLNRQSLERELGSFGGLSRKEIEDAARSTPNPIPYKPHYTQQEKELLGPVVTKGR